MTTVIKCIEEHKLESQMSTKDIEKHLAELEKAKKERKRSSKAIKSQSEKAKKEEKRSVEAIKSQTEKDKEEGKRSAEAINSQTKWAHPSNGGGVVAGAGVDAASLLRKPSPPSSFSLLNSSTLLPKHTSSVAFAHSTYSDLHRPAPVASIPFYNLPGQGIYDRESQGIYRSAYNVGSNPSSLSRSHLYPSDSLLSSLYGVGSFHGSAVVCLHHLLTGLHIYIKFALFGLLEAMSCAADPS